MMTPAAEALSQHGRGIRALSAERAALYPLTPTARGEDHTACTAVRSLHSA